MYSAGVRSANNSGFPLKRLPTVGAFRHGNDKRTGYFNLFLNISNFSSYPSFTDHLFTSLILTF